MLDTPEQTVSCQILTLTNEAPDFYPLLGPFLARRAIVQEMGGPMYDDDGMQWFVALSETRQVLGFAALRQKGERVELDNSYVLPEWRGKGIYRQLLSARLDVCPTGAIIRALTTSKSVDALLRRGFTIRRYRGQYAEVEYKKEG